MVAGYVEPGDGFRSWGFADLGEVRGELGEGVLGGVAVSVGQVMGGQVLRGVVVVGVEVQRGAQVGRGLRRCGVGEVVCELAGQLVSRY